MSYFKKFDYVPNQIVIKKELFEREASELGIHVLNDFYESNLFKAKHRIEDKKIICDL